MEHLERDKVLVNCQFGFRRGRSRSMNLLSFYSRVVDIVQERDRWVDGVYSDLKKAFDKSTTPKIAMEDKKIWKNWRKTAGVDGGLSG